MRKLPKDELDAIRDKDPEQAYQRADNSGWRAAERDISKLLGHIDALEREIEHNTRSRPSSSSNVGQQIADIESGHVTPR